MTTSAGSPSALTNLLPGGPLKLFDCRASLVVAYVPAMVGAVPPTVSFSPGASTSTERSWSVFPETLAVHTFDDGVPEAVVTVTAPETTGAKPVKVTFAAAGVWLLAVDAEHGAGLVAPQLVIETVKVAPASTGLGVIPNE